MTDKIVFNNICVKKKFTDKNGDTHTRTILENISFSIKNNEIFALLGPSGSGKTTLLRLINRLEDPQSGNITIDGKNIIAIPVLELRRKTGLVSQLPHIFPGNVRDNIIYGPLLNKTNPDHIERTLQRYLPWFNLPADILEREPAKLSVGEKQRICLLRTLMNEPEVLLMDEPTAALDQASAAGILELVKEINRKENMTVVMVTHIPQHAQNVAHRSLTLENGKIREINNIKTTKHPQENYNER